MLLFLLPVRSVFRGREVLHSNEKKERIALFVSIPKNASQSVVDILKLEGNRDEDDTTSLVVHENHQRLKVSSQRYDLRDLFVFCFSRNPYDRCISWYEYHRHIEPYASLTFRTWIEQGMPHHWKVQNRTDYVQEGISPLLQYNFVERHRVDFVGKVENFSIDLARTVETLNMICERKGLIHRFVCEERRITASQRVSDLAHYYDSTTRELVASVLKKDFQHFGYAPCLRRVREQRSAGSKYAPRRVRCH